GELSLTATGPNSFVLRIEKPLKTDLEVSIVDYAGEKLHHEILPTSTQVNKLYNLDALPHGKYKLVVADVIIEATYEFELAKSLMIIDNQAEDIVYKPTVTTDAGVATISYFNLKNRKLVVTVYDNRSQEVFSDVLKGEGLLEKRYDFTKLPKNSYELVVSTGRHSVTREMALK
ncbi:MAG: hypothetical protein AAFU03_14675, partial [Bacteroidota bacterium]